MLPQPAIGRTRVTGSGVLMLVIWLPFLPLLNTPSTWTARLGRSSCDSPPLNETASGCSISSLVMLTFGVADTVTNACGDSPPYGSGYEGLRMLTELCSSVFTSLRRVFANTLL